jgi:tRNA A-37 threonylcarbamoyl transferase component Bud32
VNATAAHAIARVDAGALRAAGRAPATPFCLALADGSELVVQRLLRVLPGKRIVGEGQWQGRRVLVKVFVGRSSARHWALEKAGVDALRQGAVATPELLLAGSLAGGGAVLLTTYLDGAQSLAEDWAALAALPAGAAAALAALRPALRMLGSMHAAGLVHDDPHLGNFLRCDGALFVVDGDAVRAVAPGKVPAEQRLCRNLALLLAQLPVVWDGCRQELLAAYRAGGGRGAADLIRLQLEVKRARAGRLADFLAKTLRDCSLFAVERRLFRFTAVQRDAAPDLAPLLASPDAALQGGSLLKDGRTCTVAKAEIGGRVVVIKRYNIKGFGHLLTRLWRPTRAWQSWRAGHRLRFHGIATPAPLALIEERAGPLRRRGFLINEFCPGLDLLHLLSPDQEPDAAVAGALTGLFGTLHALRISHGDLKATNLLWHDGRVWVIDLDALVQHRSVHAHAQAWRRDRERLLRNWPECSPLHRWLAANLPPAASGS